MSKHYPRNIQQVANYSDGAIKIRFDCACGMTGDEHIADTLDAAKDKARSTCRDHGITVQARIGRALLR